MSILQRIIKLPLLTVEMKHYRMTLSTTKANTPDGHKVIQHKQHTRYGSIMFGPVM